jgi:hypothetical protein
MILMRPTTALPGAAPTMLTCRLRSCRLALAVQAPCCQRLGARSRWFCAPLRLHAYSTRAQLAEATTDDAHVEATRVTLGAVQSQEAFCYGEGINMLQHALQAAQAAREQGETADAVLAALRCCTTLATHRKRVWRGSLQGTPTHHYSPRRLMIALDTLCTRRWGRNSCEGLVSPS